MVLPRWLARLNRRLINPVAAKLAADRGPFSKVVHIGRKSGKERRTPVTVFVDGTTYRIALTYGPSADWVLNVMAAGEFWLEHRRTLVHLTELEIVDASQAVSHVPSAVKAALRTIGTDFFLVASE
ncbi:MAG: nitroreductase family deazaflavin-dependent oxidoreductase [Acidimicrobiia bacterium]|nr:nitroreductase family deazaflavin-dependent oxidoreductase [Acidimicrobiia bacterium]